jgi:hypothetical protein
MASEGSQADLDFALSQTAGAPPTPPAPPSDASPDPIQPTPGTPDPNGWLEPYDGSTRREEHTPHSAARELAFARRKRGLEADGSVPEKITTVQYQDGRPFDQEVSAAEAARDLSAYRQATAAKLLEELTGQQPAPQPEATPAPQPELPQYSQAELEIAANRQQAQEQAQHAASAAQNYDALLQAQLHQMLGVAAGEFADLKTEADVQRLAQSDPQKFARFMDVDQRFRAVQAELGRIRQQQAETYAANYRQYAQQHDAEVERHIPELADPKTRAVIQQAARDVLREVGFTDDELSNNWQHGNSAVLLRDHRVQRVVADAARYRLGQQRAKEALKMPVPEVVRPGVRGPQVTYHDQMIQAANKELSSTGSLRSATALRRAQYAQRRNG